MRILAFIIVFAVALMMPWWFFLLVAAAYVLRWQGLELLVIAVLVDAQFGTSGVLYGALYTTTVATLVLLGTLIKPHLRAYQDIV